MSLWQSYRNLKPRTRVLIGVGAMAYSVVGIFLSDKAEEYFGMAPTEEDKKRLEKVVPKIHVVEKE